MIDLQTPSTSGFRRCSGELQEASQRAARLGIADGCDRMTVDLGVGVGHTQGGFSEETHLRRRLQRHRHDVTVESFVVTHDATFRIQNDGLLASRPCSRTSPPSAAFNAIMPETSTRSLRRGDSRTLANPSPSMPFAWNL